MNAYVAELRRLSEHCAFGAQLNEYLRDRFVCGLGSEAIQQKLLSVKDLTLEKALSVARGYESASRDVKLIHGSSSSAMGVHQQSVVGEDEECVHKLQLQQTRQRDTRECYRCGNPGHLANSCPYSSLSCRRCGKKGHLEKKCRLPDSYTSETGGSYSQGLCMSINPLRL